MKTITKFFMIIVALFAATLSYGQELVVNGNFEAGQTNWIGNAFNVVTESGNKYNAANVASPGNPWDVNLSQVLSLTAGQTYKLKFDAWSDINRTLIAGIGLNEGPWSSATETITLSTTSQTFTLTLLAPATSANSRVIFDMGAAAGFVGIDNVSLMLIAPTCTDGIQNGDETGVDCGGSCTACAAGNIPAIAAPVPPSRNASDVVSIFSNAYTNINVNTWGPDWGPYSSRINDLTIASDATKVMKVSAGQVFAGIDFSSSLFDASSFTHFHMDYWIANPLPVGQVLNIKLSNHIGGTGETNAVIFTHPVSTGGSWISLDIPLSDFSYAGGNPNGTLDRTAIAQVVLDAARADINTPLDIYMDNIYFHKNTTLGVNNQKTNDVVIFPNPVINDLNIKTDVSVREVLINNVLGQSVKKLAINSTKAMIDLGKLSAGNYFIVVKFEDGTSSTQKFIKL